MIYYDELSERIKEFESKVINFILSNLTKEEKEEYENGDEECKNGASYVPNLTLPKGCKALGLPEYSVVKIRYGVILENLQEMYSKFERTYQDKKFSFVLIYHTDNPTEFIFSEEKSIIVLKYEELFERKYKITHKYKEISCKQKIENCKKAFRKGNCTLFIGAGVGISAGLPGWDELISKTKDIVINAKKVEDKDINEIEKLCGNSTLVKARYLRILSKSEKNFYDYVRKALYSKKVNTQDKLLLSIVNLICNSNFNGKVQKVITYNFDDLLEYAISNKSKSVKPQIVVDKKCHIEEGHLSIVHVHGVIPNFYKVDSHFSTSNIVFSEEAYHCLYNQPYSWANIEQMQALRDSTCFFIGLSMTDPSLRRLLEAAKNSNGAIHYAFLRKVNLSNNLLTTKNEEVVDEMFSELGVQVIWYDEYKELPDLLNSLINDKRQNINQ